MPAEARGFFAALKSAAYVDIATQGDDAQ